MTNNGACGHLANHTLGLNMFDLIFGFVAGVVVTACAYPYAANMLAQWRKG